MKLVFCSLAVFPSLTVQHFLTATVIIRTDRSRHTGLYISQIRASACVTNKLLPLCNLATIRIWDHHVNIVTAIITALMWPLAQLCWKLYLYFPNFPVNRVTESLQLSLRQVAFLSARSETWLLLLAPSSTDRKVFIGHSQGNHESHSLINRARPVRTLQTNTE